jgi:hypothetical protein
VWLQPTSALLQLPPAMPLPQHSMHLDQQQQQLLLLLLHLVYSPGPAAAAVLELQRVLQAVLLAQPTLKPDSSCLNWPCQHPCPDLASSQALQDLNLNLKLLQAAAAVGRQLLVAAACCLLLLLAAAALPCCRYQQLYCY